MASKLLTLVFIASVISSTAQATLINYTRVFDSLDAINVETNTDAILPDGDSINDNYSETSVSVSSNNSEYGSRSVYAEADLNNRSLKASASASENTSQTYSSNFASVQSFGLAEFGDSFSFQNSDDNSPFIWDQNDNFTFNLDITGSFSGTNVRNNQTSVSLVLFELGGLSDYLSGELNQAQTDILAVDSFIDQYYWTFGHDSDLCFFQSYETDVSCNVTNILGNTFDETLIASFNPSGDFDWFLNLTVGGAISLNNSSASLNSDFANSVYLNYATPDGVNTVSQSGLLSNVNDLVSVPEPESLALLILGIAGLGLSRRRAC